MNAAALPGGAEYLADRGLQPFMRIGDDELDAAQTPARKAAQELDPEGFGLAMADGHSQHLAPSIGIDAHRDDDRHRDNMMAAPGLDVGGVEPDVRPVALERPRQKGANPLVDLGTEAGDLALADPFHSHRLDQVVHRPGRYALDVGFLDHRGQRLLRHPPRLQEGGEVAAPPQLRDPQLDSAGAGLPVAVAIAVALVAPFGGALAMRRTTELLGLEFHQPLRRKADHLAQKTGVRTLLKQFTKGDLVIGHRRGPRVGVAGCNPTLPKGYLPGLPEWVLRELKVSSYFLSPSLSLTRFISRAISNIRVPKFMISYC